MKKRVKKIPKYNRGTGGITASVYNAAQKDAPNIFNTQASKDFIQTADNIDLALNQLNPFQTEMNWAEMNSKLRTGSVIGAVGTAANLVSNSIGKKATVGGAINGALQGASAGMTIGGPWGAAIGAVGGAALSSIGTGGNVDMTTGEITMPSGIAGIFGHSKGYLRRKSNMVKNALASRTLTENLRTDYYNNTPGVGSINVLAAEGGIMRQPVDALVSKGELIYNPETKQLNKVPGSKGKPNKKDDVAVKLYEGDVVISNSPTMLMANGKTPAQNLENMVTIDKKKNNKLSEGIIKAREAVIKKVVNWQEANKTKPQEYATFSDGWDGKVESWDDYLKRKYNLSKDNAAQELNDFWGYDSKAGKYTDGWDRIINYIGKNDKLKAKAIKDLSGLSYIGNGANAWDNIVKAAHDKNVRDVHRYFRQVGDNMFYDNPVANYEPYSKVLHKVIREPYINERVAKTNGSGVKLRTFFKPSTGEVLLSKVTPEQLNASASHYSNLKWPKEKRSNNFGDVLDNLTDLAPIAAAMLGDYDYHIEQPYINPAKYVPTGVSIDPIRRAADESYAMARYNLTNINPNTGAGMAYGLQAASNRAKALSDAYQWQQEQQNKLIGQNVGIYNTWAPMEAQARHTANTETRQNEAAAQQMKDSAIRDAYEFMTGRRNDRWKLSMLEPMFKYAVDDKIWKKFKV